MKRKTPRSFTLTALALCGLGASVALTGCWEKEGGRGDCTAPNGSACTTAATVVDLSATTGCGLALRLADGTYVVPTGSTWTNFHATVGQQVLVGYPTNSKGKNCAGGPQKTCSAGPTAELGCISIVATPSAT